MDSTKVYSVLKRTFCHLPGVSKSAEQRLWSRGIIDWDCFERHGSTMFSPKKFIRVRNQLLESRKALNKGNIRYFMDLLPLEERIRVYPDFRDAVVFLDIETTGLSRKSQITTIALYDGNQARTFVRDKNLDDFVKAILEYDLIVTYNGTRFDIPFIRKEFGIKLDIAHLDLLPVLHKLGYFGGLKKIEKILGIVRQAKDMNGKVAIDLWDKYQKQKDILSLKNLLDYNMEDAKNLEKIINYISNRFLRNIPGYRRIALN